MSVTTICVVAFRNISPFQLAVPCLVFGENSLNQEGLSFQIKVCRLEEGEMPTRVGFSIQAPYSLEELRTADMVVVPSWRDPAESPPQELLQALIEAHKRGAIIVGLCTGAFVLAAAGLLDNRPATTHWLLTAELASRFPLVTVKPKVLYVDDGEIITSAGVAAGLDCCLHLLRRLCGAEVAGRVARRLVVSPHRQGGQAQFIEQPIREYSGEDRFAQAMEWLQRHPEQPHTLDSLAGRFIMSRRTFTRWFKKRTGATVSAWLLHQRLALAQRLLETTSKSLDQVAAEAGLGSEASLRHHFRKMFHTSPGRYRKEFRGG